VLVAGLALRAVWTRGARPTGITGDAAHYFASPQPNVGRGSAILVQQRKIMAISATTL
jgi:hypothetical protein